MEQTTQAIATEVERAVEAEYQSRAGQDPGFIRDELLLAIPALVAFYGDSAAAVAAEYYDDLRALAPVRTRYRASLAQPLAPDLVQKRVRFGAGHLFTDTPDLIVPFLQGAAVKYVLDAGRQTIAESTRADPEGVGWRRVPNAGACNFCRDLAGQGGVYRSEMSSTFASHDACKCSAEPSWDPDAPEVDARLYTRSRQPSKMGTTTPG